MLLLHYNVLTVDVPADVLLGPPVLQATHRRKRRRGRRDGSGRGLTQGANGLMTRVSYLAACPRWKWSVILGPGPWNPRPEPPHQAKLVVGGVGVALVKILLQGGHDTDRVLHSIARPAGMVRGNKMGSGRQGRGEATLGQARWRRNSGMLAATNSRSRCNAARSVRA